MSRLVEVCPTALGEVCTQVDSTWTAIEEELAPLRWRLVDLRVPVGDLDRVLGVGHELGTDVLPRLRDKHAAAVDLASMRYSGAFERSLPVLDGGLWDWSTPWPTTGFRNPVSVPPQGSTPLCWDPLGVQDLADDAEDTAASRGIADWFADRWEAASDAVSDATDWVSGKASQVGDALTSGWNAVTSAGAWIADWWDTSTADLGDWFDTELAGVREFLGRHVGLMRVVADWSRIVGWVVVGVGAVATVGLSIIGAMGGTALGAVFGLGVGAVPGGAAGAAIGASMGLKVLGVGFTLVALGDLTDTAADWAEGSIDGQELVQRGALELGLAATSLLGVGVIGKLLQRAVRALPDHWHTRIDDWFKRAFPQRVTDPDPDYGIPRPGHGTYDPKFLPDQVHPSQRHLGGDLDHPWGHDPDTGLPLTKAEYDARYVTEDGGVRWPPNGGAVPGSIVRYDHNRIDDFINEYGDRVDRIGNDGGPTWESRPTHPSPNAHCRPQASAMSCTRIGSPGTCPTT